MPADPRVDTYIESQRPFARPILAHLRVLVHDVAPQTVETVKWSRPFFMIDERPFCYIAGFKAHAAFGFWQSLEPTGREGEALGSLGRLTSLADLPSDVELRAMLASAAARAGGERPKRTVSVSRPVPPIPDDLALALAQAPTAAARFTAWTPGRRRERIAWIEDAKRPETRMRRIAGLVEQLSADPACAALQNN